jgi:cytochrome c553
MQEGNEKGGSMRKIAILSSLLALALLVVGGVIVADETAKEEVKATPVAKHEYAGSATCKLCHKVQYDSWSQTPHAKAFSKLSAEEQKKPECVKCHITGTKADGTVIQNVECEACHGPGADYKSPKIMNKAKWAADPATHKKLAIDAGLIYPTEKDCVRCHTKEGNPNFKEFKFAERKGLVHTMGVAKTAGGK